MLIAFADFQPSNFWKWSYFVDYVYAIVMFILFGGCCTILFLEYSIYTEVIGFLAVFTEAMLGVPQFYQNYKNHDTTGMRYMMYLDNLF